MQHQTTTFSAHNKLNLFTQSWLPDTTSTAGIFLVHGVGEHSNRYGNLINHLVPQGYAIYSYDQRGHGQSPGARLYIDSWAEYREDLRAFVQYVRDSTELEKFFIFGHSMGGLVTLDYALHYPDGLAGILTSAPALDTSGASPILKLIAKILSRVAPKMQIKTTFDPNELSRDPKIVQAYVDDPLVQLFSTPRWGTEIMKTIDWVQKNAGTLSLPLLLTHGEADKVVSIAGTHQFFPRVASTDKTLITYPDGRHESHNEMNKDEVVANIAAWLNERV